MLSYDDKRDFRRMPVDCPAMYSSDAQGIRGEGTVKDLSASGVLMWIQQAVDAESILTIEVKPLSPITPPLKAEVKVLRCTPIEGGRGSFAVACEMLKILD